MYGGGGEGAGRRGRGRGGDGRPFFDLAFVRFGSQKSSNSRSESIEIGEKAQTPLNIAAGSEHLWPASQRAFLCMQRQTSGVGCVAGLLLPNATPPPSLFISVVQGKSSLNLGIRNGLPEALCP